MYLSCLERRKKKNSDSHQESNLRPSESALRCSTTEPQTLWRAKV